MNDLFITNLKLFYYSRQWVQAHLSLYVYIDFLFKIISSMLLYWSLCFYSGSRSECMVSVYHPVSRFWGLRVFRDKHRLKKNTRTYHQMKISINPSHLLFIWLNCMHYIGIQRHRMVILGYCHIYTGHDASIRLL